jgi:hypothetical protein
MQLRAYAPVLRPLQAAQGQPGKADGTEVHVTSENMIDDSELHLKPTYETRVYINQDDEIVIKQSCPYDDDVIVCLDKRQARAVIDHMKKLLKHYAIKE